MTTGHLIQFPEIFSNQFTLYKNKCHRKNTIICIHYANNGICHYKGCQYAHGVSWIVCDDTRKYRKIECREYAETGKCRYNKNCYFKHKDRLLKVSNKIVRNPTIEDPIENQKLLNIVLLNELYSKEKSEIGDLLFEIYNYNSIIY
jgi:hypothetical protein